MFRNIEQLQSLQRARDAAVARSIAPQHVCRCGRVVKAEADGRFWLFSCDCGRTFSQHRASVDGRFAYVGPSDV